MAAANCPADDPNSEAVEALYPEGATPEVRVN